MLRLVVVVAGLVSALPAMGGEMTASEARHFVVAHLGPPWRTSGLRRPLRW